MVLGKNLTELPVLLGLVFWFGETRVSWIPVDVNVAESLGTNVDGLSVEIRNPTEGQNHSGCGRSADAHLTARGRIRPLLRVPSDSMMTQESCSCEGIFEHPWKVISP